MSDLTPSRLKLYGLIAAGAALVIVAGGAASRIMTSHRVGEWTEAQAIPTVKVITLGHSNSARNLVLPGTIQPFSSAPIYARVSGYLKHWYVDIGAPVKAGQLLAEIDVPDQDQQLAASRADLNTALANQQLSAVTAKRWNQLLRDNAVSPQDVDEKNGDLAAKNALVAAARADVDRLSALSGFKRLTAPFSGVITSRSVDEGALINVGASGATPLFTVADVTHMRLYVQVPQGYSADIRPGIKARFNLPEYPGRDFTATVSAQSNAVNVQTGAMLVQLQADNVDGALKAGAYAQVRFDLPERSGVIQVPASALMFGANGMTVAEVGPDNRVRIKPVIIGHDFGATVELASGVSPGDRIIDNPPDSLRPNDPVRVAAANAPSGD